MMSYTLNLLNIICQLCLNKAEKKKEKDGIYITSRPHCTIY